MTSHIEKAVRKLSPKEREIVKLLVLRIKMDDTVGLDIKLLRGHRDMLRVRKGRLRMVYIKNEREFIVVKVGKRDDQTYKEF